LIISLEKNYDIWNEIINNFSQYLNVDIYFTPKYHQLNLKNNENPLAFVFRYNNEVFFLPFLKKKIENIDYFDFETMPGYSGPLSSSIEKNFLVKAWENFSFELNKLNIIAGIIRFNPILENHKYFHSIDNCKIEKIRKTVIIDFKDKNYEHDFSKNVFRNLNKANKNNVYHDSELSDENINFFYSLYNESMLKKNADLRFYYKKSYFFELIKNFHNNIKLLIAFQNNKVLGGILSLHHNSIANVHLSAYNSMGLRNGVAYYLRYNLIKYYQDKVSFLHFGGGNSNKDDDSLLRFKKNFSNNLIDYYIASIIINKKIYYDEIKKWSKSFPEKIKNYENYFLKYRF
jgi:hypothetical protein